MEESLYPEKALYSEPVVALDYGNAEKDNQFSREGG